MKNAAYEKKTGKLNRCNTCKQQERLFLMGIKTKLYIAQNI